MTILDGIFWIHFKEVFESKVILAERWVETFLDPFTCEKIIESESKKLRKCEDKEPNSERSFSWDERLRITFNN